MKKINEIFDELEKVSREVKSRRVYLNSELSKVDKEISDLEHYIELYSLNICQFYKVYEMMKDCLIRRREVKNEIYTLNRISVMNVGYVANGKGRNCLNNVKDKQYHPRVLNELFEPAGNEKSELQRHPKV